MAADEIIIETTSQEVVEIGVVGPQGPQGPKGDPGDVAGLPLSAQGDTLYRGASQNERLPIGQNSQILKIVNGLPAWANESGAVSSVNGETGAVVLDAGDVGAAKNLEYLSISTPSSAPFIVNLAANKQYLVTKTTSNEVALYLPETASDGDRIIVRWFSGSVGDGLTIVRQGGSPFLQTIGRLRSYGVFHVVWAGLWRADFVPPSGLGLAPSTPTSNGIAGDMAYADPYLYVCVANNNWRRVPVASWS